MKLPIPPIIKKNRKKHLRNLDRNSSGREATVKLAYNEEYDAKGKKVFHVYPTITFKNNENARPQSYKEAISAGEVYEFKNENNAKRFAAGSWKKGELKKKAMKQFRKDKNK